MWLGALGLLLNGCAKETAPAGCGDTGGTRLVVFASDRNQTVGQHDLYLYDLDAGGFRLIGGINTGSPEGNPSISPDAELIAFEATRGASGSDIFLYSRCDQTIVGLPAGVNTAAAETEPAFSGDSNKLAFTRVVSGFRRIFLVDGVGDTLIPLPGLDTTAAYSDWAPSPNQDGSLIAFVSDRNGTPDVFVWDRALRMVRLIPVLQSDSLDLEPSLTPDGHYLTFASNRAGGAGGFDLYLFNLFASAMVPLSVNAATDARNPSISRDGERIAFQSDRATTLGGWDLWMLNRVSGNVTQPAQLSSNKDDIAPSLRWP